jgi:hypothetical protein
MSLTIDIGKSSRSTALQRGSAFVPGKHFFHKKLRLGDAHLLSRGRF